MTEQQCHDAAARREYLDGYRQEPCQRMQEINEVRDTILVAVQKRIPGKKGIEASREIADEVMDAIAENYRTITEVHEIVEAVRLGMDVQIAYADPSEDEPDPYIVRPCW